MSMTDTPPKSYKRKAPKTVFDVERVERAQAKRDRKAKARS
jgi:hypothetical protein